MGGLEVLYEIFRLPILRHKFNNGMEMASAHACFCLPALKYAPMLTYDAGLNEHPDGKAGLALVFQSANRGSKPDSMCTRKLDRGNGVEVYCYDATLTNRIRVACECPEAQNDTRINAQ
jgi:hypothetical protein